VNAYVFFLGAGASLGLLRVAQAAPDLMANRQVNRGLLLLLGCLFGARAVYVLERWPYYQVQKAEIIQLLNGGLSAAGAIAGGIVALVLIAFVQRTALFQLADDLILLVPPLAVSIWLGCWLAGCAYGPLVLPDVWWGVPAADESGLVSTRLPLQPLAAAILLASFWLLESRLAPAHPRAGQLASLGCLVLGLNLVIFLLLRSEPARLWWSVPLDVWVAAVLCLIGLVSAIWVFRPMPGKPRPDVVG
jgi:prolipoprotein diacylglyceryltransferase